MNRLYLIGNGFDLAHGLKTKYEDFLLWYMKKGLMQALSKRYFHGSNFTIIKNENVTVLDEQISGINTIDELKQYLKLVGEDKVAFRLEFDNNTDFFIDIWLDWKLGWVDIENRYYDSLDKTIRRTGRGQYIKALNSGLEKLKKELNEYLLKMNKNVKVSDPMKSLFDDDSIDNKFKDKMINGECKMLLLNFNYTDIIEKYIPTGYTHTHKGYILDYDLCYIHGRLNDSLNPMIFGYGDETTKEYENIEKLEEWREYLRFYKTFAYSKTNNYQKVLSFIESSDFEVYVIGHSCGLSDRTLLKAIFENKNCKHIKIFYHKISDTKNNYMELYQNISRNFSPYNRNELRKKVSSFQDSKPLSNL